MLRLALPFYIKRWRQPQISYFSYVLKTLFFGMFLDVEKHMQQKCFQMPSEIEEKVPSASAGAGHLPAGVALPKSARHI